MAASTLPLLIALMQKLMEAASLGLYVISKGLKTSSGPSGESVPPVPVYVSAGEGGAGEAGGGRRALVSRQADQHRQLQQQASEHRAAAGSLPISSPACSHPSPLKSGL